MVQWQSSQPVIVLSSGKKNPAQLAFHLAHELGHLALGHRLLLLTVYCNSITQTSSPAETWVSPTGSTANPLVCAKLIKLPELWLPPAKQNV